MKMKNEASENLTPAEKNGVKDSSPYLIAIQVEPQMKLIAAYARAILTASLFNRDPSSKLRQVLCLIQFHLSCRSEASYCIQNCTIRKPEYLFF